MRVCKIWDADYPWDIRVEKIAMSLSAAGHAVHLVCRNQQRRARREWTGSFTIHRLPSLPPVLGRAHALLNLPYPANPVWIHAMARTIREAEADLILVRDLPLALPAAILGRMRRIPVILDMAENYPAMLQDRYRYTPTGPMDRLVRHPGIARVVERLTVRMVDHIIVVVEESRDRLVEAGVKPARISIVSNTPRPDQWGVRGALRDAFGRDEGTHLIYLGNLDGSRGIDTAIRAVRYLKDQGRLVRLSVIGDGPCISGLRDLASRLDVADRVTISGRLAFSRVQTIMTKAHVGIIPHYATDAWNSTIPNKLFDYMLTGLPVIVSDAKPTARIVRAEGCGEVFRDRDAQDLAQCVIALDDPESLREKALKGQSAVRRRYNWNHDAHVLVETVERVQEAARKRPWRRADANVVTATVERDS